MSEPPTHPAPDSDAIHAGDLLARSGQWTDALSAWFDAARADPALQPVVARRLEWLVDEAGEGSGRRWSRQAMLVAVFAVTALLAAALVAVAGEPGTGTANVLAAAAWVLIVVSSVAAILAARGPSREPFDHLVLRASRVARQLDARNEGNESTT